MSWHVAKQMISRCVQKGTDLCAPTSSARPVLKAGPIRDSKRYGYRNESGFIVSLGPTSHVNIPWSMLEQCFHELSRHGEYDHRVFARLYRQQSKDRRCHVHVVGQIFVRAGLAELDWRTYIKR